MEDPAKVFPLTHRARPLTWYPAAHRQDVKAIGKGKKKCKEAKWLSEEALQRAVKRRVVKSKGEKEGYTHLNAEFQRIARRDKKAFLGEQCKEIEENNRMGMTRGLFKNIRDIKGTFHAKWGTIKDRNDKDLTEAEEMAGTHGRNIRKRIFVAQITTMV